MKKLIAFILLLVAAGGGWWYWVKYGTPPEKPTISQTAISRGPIVEAVPSTGALEPQRRYDIGSQVSGVVQKIYVDYNSMVHKGDLMAEIDPTLLQVQVDIQTANLERAKSDIANQMVQLEDAEKQFERTKALVERGLQNQQQYETAELGIKNRKSQIESAKKSLVSVQQQLNSAQLNVSYTKIIAPADGVVVERKVDQGQTVQASMTSPSFFIMNTPLNTLKLTANVDEAEIGKIRAGMEVRFKVDSYGQKQFYGVVDMVRLNATNSNGVVTYPVWITVDNPLLELRPFMTATLSIVISTVQDALRVPMAATRFRPNNDIYTALGLTPPQGGRINPVGGPETNATPGAQGAPGAQPGANGQPGANAKAGQGRTQQNAQNGQGQTGQGRTPGQGNTRGGNNTGANGGGANRQQGQGGGVAGANGQTRQPGRGMGNGANLTPEQIQAMMARYGAAGGRGGTGAGGRGNTGGGGRGGTQTGGRNGNNNPQRAAAPDMANADKIDELWAPIIPKDSPGSVWKWDGKNLTEVKLRLGVSDGTFMEIKSGDVQPGDQVLTGVTLPASMRQNNNPATNSPFGGQQKGMPGMGNPGGGGGAGGGRAPGGGGGGGGRGGN